MKEMWNNQEDAMNDVAEYELDGIYTTKCQAKTEDSSITCQVEGEISFLHIPEFAPGNNKLGPMLTKSGRMTVRRIVFLRKLVSKKFGIPPEDVNIRISGGGMHPLRSHWECSVSRPIAPTAGTVVIPPHPFIVKLVEALGLPPRTVAFTLKASLNEPVTLECESYPEPSTLERAARDFEEGERERIRFVLTEEKEPRRTT